MGPCFVVHVIFRIPMDRAIMLAFLVVAEKSGVMEHYLYVCT